MCTHMNINVCVYLFNDQMFGIILNVFYLIFYLFFIVLSVITMKRSQLMSSFKF